MYWRQIVGVFRSSAPAGAVVLNRAGQQLPVSCKGLMPARRRISAPAEVLTQEEPLDLCRHAYFLYIHRIKNIIPAVIASIKMILRSIQPATIFAVFAIASRTICLKFSILFSFLRFAVTIWHSIWKSEKIVCRNIEVPTE